MNRLLIFGCGYSGLGIARAWDGVVLGTTRARQKALHDANVIALEIEDQNTIKREIEAADAIMISTPPPCPALQYAKEINASNAWVGYLSSTAVYGDFGGDWVDETTEPNPSSERGKARYETEKLWKRAVPRINIFRLAGIYGPGRGPFEKLRSARAIKVIKKDQFFGRIHIDDIARIITASYERKDQSALYSLTDDLPAPPEDVLDYAAKLLHMKPLAPIAFEEAKLSAMARSFYSENKRVKNEKIRANFGPLLYPDYQSGLEAILTKEKFNR